MRSSRAAEETTGEATGGPSGDAGCDGLGRVEALVTTDARGVALRLGLGSAHDWEALLVALAGCVLSRYRGRTLVRLVRVPGDPAAPAASRRAPAVLPLRIEPGTSFRRLLDEVRAACAGADRPEGGPAMRRCPAAGIDGADLPDAVVAVGHGRTAHRSAGVAAASGEPATAPVLAFAVDGSVVRLEVRYPATAYADGHTAELAGCVREALSAVARTPDIEVDRIELVSPALRAKLLVELNGRQVPYPKDRTVLDLLEAQATRTPDRPAIALEAVTLTYAELDGKAAALAARLRGVGVGKGDLVPIVAPSCLELPIAMIALMKLGAAFVPVDAAWPAERVRTVVGEVRPKAVVCREPSGALAAIGAPLVAVDQAALPVVRGGEPGSRPAPGDLIYGFFTSGSTGTPKCALNVHLGLVNRFLYMSRRFGGDGADVVLQNSKHVFDSSIWQLLWPLTNGSRVVVPRSAEILDLRYTIDLIGRFGVTMTDFVPSIFNALVSLLEADEAAVARLRLLRQVLIGGEEIGWKAVRAFRVLLPHVGITNTYGPTEASIGSVFHEVTGADRPPIPIGRPIDNTYLAIVDGRLRLVPPGAVGEILIGGDCLGAGYLNDPERTRAAFVDNPFPEIPGATLYRTGDLGYHRPDGLVQFVGRRDHQVKVGGVRIELAEVEAALAGHPQVREAKVVVQGERAEQRMLVAYVVARGELDAQALKAHLARSLPGHSVPRRIVRLDAMPLTPNGKVDRKALARMAAAEPGRAPGADGALSETERAVRAVWLEVLGLGDVGVADDFFACGGDSLSALGVSLAVEGRLGTRLSVQDVFRHPTIGGQAALVERRLAGLGEEAPPATEAEAMRRDAALDPAIAACAPCGRGPLEHVLLTGATGFIGAQLLRDLLDGTGACVHCLVRAADAASAMRRLRENLARYRLWDEGLAERIVPIPGDLTRPGLGLAPEVRDRLEERIDAIVHNGAMVSFLHDYGHHRETNVSGTVEVLRLACRGRTKPVHYVSTLAVFPAGAALGRSARLPEDAEPSDDALPERGYGRSKWVAERLVARARARGIPAAVYRLGEVMPHSRTGIPNHKALTDTIIRGCLALGLRFTSGIVLDYTPVDYVSRFVVAAAARGEPPGGAYHVLRAAPVRFDDLLASFDRDAFGLRDVRYGEFWCALREACARDPADRDLMLLLALMPEAGAPAAGAGEEPDDLRAAGLFVDGTRAFSTSRTEAALRDLAVEWPPVGRAAFDAYAAHHLARLTGRT